MNEIIWRRAFGHSDSGRLGSIHDTLFLYSKSEQRIWNQMTRPADAEYIDTFFDQFDPDRGERYQRLSLFCRWPVRWRLRLRVQGRENALAMSDRDAA